MRTMMRWLAFGMLPLLLLPNSGLAVVATDLPAAEKLLEEADVAVHGVVARVESRWADSTIETTATVTVTQTFKGAAEPTVEFTYLGGIVGDLELHSAAVPVLQREDEIVVFLRRNEHGRLVLIDGTLGIYRVIRHGAVPYVRRDLRGFLFLNAPAGFQKQRQIEEQPLADFLQGLGAGPGASSGAATKQFVRSENEGTGRYLWWAYDQMPIRFHFDAATFIAYDPSRNVGDIENVIRQVLGRWTDISGSYLALTYAGQQSPGGDPPRYDGVNLLGVTSLDGRVAAVAWAWRWPTGQIPECDIAFNRQYPQFGQPHFFFGFLLHEMGHCVGLDHSEDSTAIMYFQHAEGRVTELNEDDAAGLRRTYPEPQRLPEERIPEISIWPANGQVRPPTLNLEIHILQAGGRERLRSITLEANGMDHTWVFEQYRAQVAYPTPHGWVLHLPRIVFPQWSMYPMEIKACGITDRGVRSCESRTYW